MTINKYKLYVVVLVIVFGFFLVPRVYYLMTYHKTTGKFSGYHDEQVYGSSGSYTNHYPIIEFQTAQYSVSFLAPSYMYDLTRETRAFTVIYNPKNPEDAYVLSFLGLFGNAFIYLLPFFLIWSIFIFSPGIIPKQIRLRIPL